MVPYGHTIRKRVKYALVNIQIAVKIGMTCAEHIGSYIFFLFQYIPEPVINFILLYNLLQKQLTKLLFTQGLKCNIKSMRNIINPLLCTTEEQFTY